MGEESNSILLLFLCIHVHLNITFHLQYIVTYLEECELKKKKSSISLATAKMPSRGFHSCGTVKKKKKRTMTN